MRSGYLRSGGSALTRRGPGEIKKPEDKKPEGSELEGPVKALVRAHRRMRILKMSTFHP